MPSRPKAWEPDPFATRRKNRSSVPGANRVDQTTPICPVPVRLHRQKARTDITCDQESRDRCPKTAHGPYRERGSDGPDRAGSCSAMDLISQFRHHRKRDGPWRVPTGQAVRCQCVRSGRFSSRYRTPACQGKGSAPRRISPSGNRQITVPGGTFSRLLSANGHCPDNATKSCFQKPHHIPTHRDQNPSLAKSG